MLVKVSAEALHDEEMIKLPIIVGEVSNSPDKTIDFTVQKRAALEKIAATESEYIRPIALYQAENKNREYNVEYVKNYLIEGAKIPPEEIAIAIGTKHELDGINLFLQDCRIKHIITVQALKEGWDCPFASVFCSLSNTHSLKDVEQLLGRVLRMPYAKRRRSPELNQAYAFFRVDSWTEAVKKIKDDLIGMGFDNNEVNFALHKQPKLFNEKVTFTIQTEETSNINSLNLALQSQIEVEKTDTGYQVVFKDCTDEDLFELENNKNRIFKKSDDRSELSKAIRKGYFTPQTKKSPAESGVKFSIPLLCLDFGNGAEVIKDREDFLPDTWSLNDVKDYSLPLSHVESDIKFYELTLNGNKLKEKLLIDDRQNLLALETNWTLSELINWIAEKIVNKHITPAEFAEFTRRILSHLMNDKSFSLNELVRLRFSIKNL